MSDLGQVQGSEREARPARIMDVARAAAVSVATVSRALSDPDALRPATRQRVLDAIRQLNYTPHQAARALRAGATRMAFVAVPRLYAGSFFAGVVNGIDSALAEAGYTMIMGSLDSEAEKARRLIDLVYARQFDGVIILSNSAGPSERRSVLDAGVPVVAVCAPLPGSDHPAIVIDDTVCALAQTRHLIELGHRRLLYVSGIEGHYNEVARHRGFRQAARAAGIPDADQLSVAGDYTLSSGEAAGRYFLGLEDRPTGVVCCSDDLAIGFMKTVREAGLQVPRDVSVVGFDDIEFARFCDPALTTIHQPRGTIGALGARLLLDALAGEAPPREPVVVQGSLIRRASTGRAPRRRRPALASR